MQSINAGFQSLRNLLPIPDGEKLSKAAILQQTTNLIYRLEQEKTQLLNQIAGLKKMIRKGELDPDSPGVKKRKRNDSMMDEGIGSPEGLEESSMEEMQKNILELRSQLDRERQYRKVLEDKNRVLEAKFYPEKIKELTRQIQIKEEAPVEEKGLREKRLEEIQEQERRQLEEQHLAAAAAALESYSHQTANTALISCTQTTTTAAIRQNLETIYKAIRHVEGATPVQTPNPTPTPEDERRLEAEEKEGEPEGRIRVIRQIEDIDEADFNDGGGDRQRIKVQLVHPLHMLTTRPTSITVS
ncbi:Transcription factor AP-4 [Holothuria leucospilota]|uniref:Transcription factor AP-4 n=1 Tax=Holothuria leucospilota TaxID=206669 RepID=A0A9Q1BK78_HOLLE|nr:Transcription factor AP-4 [Holothuria leucospilota]